MPVQLTTYHPDRLVIGRASGDVTIADIVTYARDIQNAGLIHYRKVLDVIDARPAFTAQELRAIAQLVREVPVGKRRGALAFVVDPHRGEFAKLFAALEIDGRPARVFKSIHDARKWLAGTPVDD